MLTLFVLAALAQPAPAAPQQPTGNAQAPAPARLSIMTTPIADLIANPAARAILDRHFPGLTTHPRIGQAAAMTLRTVQPFSEGLITDAGLQAVEAELAALAAR